MNWKLAFGAAFFLSSMSLYGQYQSVGFGLGSSAFRGETSNDNLAALEELGRSAYFHYNGWLKDERWQYSVELSYHQIRGRIQVRDFLVSNTLYQARSRHFNLAGGMRFYLDSKLKRYQPTRGQWAFFGAAYAGLEAFYSNTEANRLGIRARQETNENFMVSPYINGLGGVRVFLDRNWYMELSAGMKYGFNDFWDGISGHTGVNDFIVYAHLSGGYAF